jgi:hypothetical protein
MKKRQKGFGAVELIIILLILLALVLGGWYVWSKMSKDKDAKATEKTATSSATGEDADTDATSPTEGWEVYSNEAGDYTFKYPAAWVFAESPEDCSAETVLFAPAAASLGKCATESGGQMQANSAVGDVRSEYQFTEAYYTSKTDEAVTVEGVTGNKLTAIVSGMEGVVEVGGWPDDTKIVRYLFFTNGRTYTITYVQQPDYPDALSDFSLLVTGTFRFSSDAYDS